MYSDELISIIIPIFNAERYLGKALESVRSQSYTNIEAVMVDDGSKDSSADMCRKFSEKDSRFVYLYQDNAGVSAARNAGLRIAKGRFITFLDSDDWIDSDCIQEMLDVLKENEADISIVTSHERYVHNPNEFKKIYSKDKALSALYHENEFEVGVWAKLFKRELFVGVEFSKDIAIAEDMIVSAKLISNAEKVVFKNTPQYHYVFNPASATKVKWNPKVWTCLKAAEELYNIMADNYPEEIIWGKLRACTTVMVIPKKLSGCGKLTKENYELLKSELMKYYAPEINEIANKREKAEFRFFFKGRIPYIIYRKSVKNKFAVRLRNFLVKRGLL